MHVFAPSSWAPCALASLLAATPATASQVWLVDAGGGGDFSTLQAAVDAAQAGDVILVDAGSYPPFSLQAKPLSIVAQPGGTVFVEGGIELVDSPQGSTTVLRGLNTGTPLGHGLVVRDCAGAVRVEECSFRGENTSSDISFAWNPSHGAWLEDSTDVWLVRSSFRGGEGANAGFFAQPYPGGAGVYAVRSTLVVTGGSAEGGSGPSSPEDESYGGAPGRPGIALFDASAWTSGLFARGGSGGDGGEDFDIFVGPLCGTGGNGGDGIELLDFPYLGFKGPLPSALVERQVSTAPGTGGGTVCGTVGQPGQAIDTGPSSAHAVTSLGGQARQFWTNSPAQGGTQLRLFSSGAPGDLVFAALGAPSPPLPVPGQAVPLSVGTLWSVLDAGTIGADGQGLATLPLPPFAAGTAQPATLQAAFVVSSGAVELGPVATPVLIP